MSPSTSLDNKRKKKMVNWAVNFNRKRNKNKTINNARKMGARRPSAAAATGKSRETRIKFVLHKKKNVLYMYRLFHFCFCYRFLFRSQCFARLWVFLWLDCVINLWGHNTGDGLSKCSLRGRYESNNLLGLARKYVQYKRRHRASLFFVLFFSNLVLLTLTLWYCPYRYNRVV